MKIEDLYNRVQNYIMVATGLDDKKIIFSAQSSSRPEKPFISISLTNFKKIGQPIKRITDNEGKEELISSMTCTASFQAFGDGLHWAETVLHDIYHSFDTELRNDIFKGEIAVHRILKEVSAVPKALNEQIESQAVFDVELSFTITHEQNVGRIASVEVEDGIRDDTFMVSGIIENN